MFAPSLRYLASFKFFLVFASGEPANMNKQYSTYPRLALLGTALGLLAACTTQSGPTYSAHAIVVPDQKAPTYRVECGGLLGNSQTCTEVAAEICKGKPVTVVEAVDAIRSGVNTNDPREITFMCGEPAVAQSVAVPAPPPQPQPQLKPQPQERRQVLLQGDANFAIGSAVLSSTAKAGLDKFVRANEGVKFRRVTITGYTDSTGSRPHNQKLSEARAQAVLQYLRSHGVMSQEFVAEGHGMNDPVASNATASGRALNRRVEVRIVAQ
ncbi:Outer membrane protein OmpA [Variovorax sp. HW608]|uniref:OmpA family protein n=1 Tax=Variovorax sp. HW608 TaxID=1034889 RepID=UPI0008201D61|nr:OmpA family protein [Variovorax sp. HW608]SCK39951.1 Outer membrane protein OmpA [Variovorax sp. HW608]